MKMKKALLGKEEDREAVYKNAHDQRRGQFPGQGDLSPGPPQAVPFQSQSCVDVCTSLPLRLPFCHSGCIDDEHGQ